ncbi:MAG: hypothetical protein ACQETK_02800 [Pseudomonadota bacterium]
MSETSTGLQLQPVAVAEPGTPEWDEFFPDDLPEDWQLAYYAHYYRRLLLPARLWPGEAGAAFGDWDEVVPEALKLWLEWPPGLAVATGVATCDELSGVLGGRLEGVVVAEEDGARAVELRAALDAAGLAALCLAGPGRVQTLPRARGARFCPLAGDCAGAPGGAWVVDPEPNPGAAGWRELVEGVIAAGGAGDTPVFLRTRPERLSDVRTIARLLGAA